MRLSRADDIAFHVPDVGNLGTPPQSGVSGNSAFVGTCHGTPRFAATQHPAVEPGLWWANALRGGVALRPAA